MDTIIVAGGQIDKPDFYRALIARHDLILAADGGSDRLRELGLTPDTVVGDLDSVSPETLAWLLEQAVELVEFPAEKDRTDTELALDRAIAVGSRSITLTACCGGRLDHTLANIYLLVLAEKKGAACRIREYGVEIHVTKRPQVVAGSSGDVVSLIALEECLGLELDGFKYRFSEGRLATGSTLGVSNVLSAPTGRISLVSGLLLIVHNRKE